MLERALGQKTMQSIRQCVYVVHKWCRAIQAKRTMTLHKEERREYESTLAKRTIEPSVISFSHFTLCGGTMMF